MTEDKIAIVIAEMRIKEKSRTRKMLLLMIMMMITHSFGLCGKTGVVTTHDSSDTSTLYQT